MNINNTGYQLLTKSTKKINEIIVDIRISPQVSHVVRIM